ncbi:SPP1 gp7 family putative phage head morphogenesis protein [Acinetobacter calcoaceticus]|uniref:SPP1 gp7 family putative phage head morphogenesis protein n=1 Tax=Acinetobacter calcoaceticus TaxID=471 RepID=A0A4R1XQG2_ACICA|nr:SPP1 gp7 family putative phage head morphogenesis protein [Acinetobacter calcoaceticus]
MQAVFGQPPRKAIEYLENKQLMPSQDWWQVQGNAHNKAFVISHMTRMDLLEDIRQSLIAAQKNGWDLKKWSEVVEPKMKARGWWGKQEVFTEDGQRSVQLGNPYRLKTIYQTNMAQAYEAGRQSVMFDDNPLFPYLQYSAILDNKTRPQHRSLHGVVMLKSDPAWQAIAPKNGYNCRCTVIELMAHEAQAQKIYDSASYLSFHDVDVSNGGIAKVAKLDLPGLPSFSTDAGWVGRPNALPTKQMMDKAISVEPQLAAKAVTQTFKNTSVAQQYNNEVKQWIQSVDTQKPRGEMRSVGTLPIEFLSALKSKKGVVLESAAITVHDRETLRHIDQDRKNHNREWFENIVEHLNSPHDLYWDKSHATPLLIFDIQQDGIFYKLVLQINQKIKGKDAGDMKQKITGNLIRTLIVEQPENILNGKDYEFLVSKK